jgi:hypothetical protein
MKAFLTLRANTKKKTYYTQFHMFLLIHSYLENVFVSMSDR